MKKKINKSSLFLRLIITLLGTAIAGFGVHLMLYSALGADPFSTMVSGIIEYVPLRFGTLCQVINLLFIVADYFLDKKQIGLSTVIYGIGCGQFINIFSDLNFNYAIHPLVLSILGVYLLGAGVAVYLFAGLGSGPVEGVMIALQGIMKMEMKYTRIIIDVSEVLLGVLLGGVWGVGTVIACFGTGPAISLTLNLLNKKVSLPVLHQEEVPIND